MTEIQSLMQEQIKLRDLYRHYVQMAKESNKKRKIAIMENRDRAAEKLRSDWHRYGHQTRRIADLITNLQSRINTINSNYYDNITINDLHKEASNELQYSKCMLPGQLSDAERLTDLCC